MEKTEKELLSKQSWTNGDIAKLVALGHLQDLISNRKRVSDQQLTLLRQLQRLEMIF